MAFSFVILVTMGDSEGEEKYGARGSSEMQSKYSVQVEHRRSTDDKFLQTYASLPVGKLGFSPEEQSIQIGVEQQLEIAAREAQGVTEGFLHYLQQNDVGIMKNSKLLAWFNEQKKGLGKRESDAFYISQGDLQSFTESRHMCSGPQTSALGTAIIAPPGPH